MRKAMSRKGTRRKQPQEGSSPTNGVANEGTTGEPGKRRATEPEAALTAKNYRLAKELSELRVRHREETKNVTRLTMENMNLASRCREAISHVAMLKKELVMHQKRSQEALASQRQRIETKATDFGSEMERIDRLMAAHTIPPPPQVTVKKEEPPSPHKDDASPTSEFFTDYAAKSQSDDTSEEDENDKLSAEGFFPHSASPQPSKRSDYNEGFPNDLPRSTRKKYPPVFRHAPPQISEIAESDNGSVESGLSGSTENRKSKLSSIDAFEASFTTDFPDSFAQKEESKKSPQEIYNPFFPSPARPNGTTREESEAEAAPVRSSLRALPNTRPKSPPPDDRKDTTHPSTPPSLRRSGPVSVDSPLVTTPSTSGGAVATSSNQKGASSPGAKETDRTEPRTPVSLTYRKVHVDEKERDEPKRPEKIISTAARARYEKALQPRGFTGRNGTLSTMRSPPKSESEERESPHRRSTTTESTPTMPEQDQVSYLEVERTIKTDVEPGRIETRGSPFSSEKNPSLVLQRLQQRRALERSPDDKALPSQDPLKTKPATSIQAESPSKPAVNSSSSTKAASPVVMPDESSINTSSPAVSRSSLPHYSSTPSPTVARNSVLASPFMRTQPNMTIPEPSRKVTDSLPVKSLGSVKRATSDSAASPSVLAASPSVSSAISAYEQAAKRNSSDISSIGKTAKRTFRSSSFGPSATSSATKSPLPGATPFDEDDSTSTARSNSRSANSFGSRTSEDEGDWNHPRNASARELQSLAKRAAGEQDDSGTDDQNSLPRSINYSQGRSDAPYAQSHKSGDLSSKFIATARNSRRSIKQPVSYSEPPLNSKLRRGDVYFAKDEDKKEGEFINKDLRPASVRL